MWRRNVKKIKDDKRPFEEIWIVEIIFFKLMGKPLQDAFRDNYRKESLIETTIALVGLLLHSSFVVLSLYTFYVVECDMLFIAELIPILFGMVMDAIKGLTLWIYRHDLFTILHDFYILWSYNQTKTNLVIKIDKLLKTSKQVRYFHMSTITLIGASFVLLPLLKIFTSLMSSSGQPNSTIEFSVIIFPLEYPFSYQTISRFSLLLLYEQAVIYLAFCYLICDAVYIQLMTHITINFLVLADDFNNLNQLIGIDYNDNDNISHMIELVNRHRQMLLICEKVKNFYNPIVFFTMALNGLTLCFCVLIIDKEISHGNWLIVIKSLVQAVGLFVQIVIYCNFSHKATEMTASVGKSIYNSEWVNSSEKFKTLIMIIMMLAKKEYQFTAYSIIILNREQMSKVFRTTMSYFTLLRSFS